MIDFESLGGWTHDPEEVALVRDSLPYPLFAAAAPALANSGQGQTTLLYKAWKDVTGGYVPYPAQSIGDCFPAGTMVLGERTRAIEHVEIGDRIWTAEGKLTNVASTRKLRTMQPLVEIRPLGSPTLTCTPDHRLLIYRIPKVNGKTVTPTAHKNAKNKMPGMSPAVAVAFEARRAEWLPAAELTEGDYLLTPVEFARIPLPESPHDLLSTDEGRFVAGYFLGNGHAGGGSVELTLPTGSPSIERLMSAFVVAGYDPKFEIYKKRNACRIRVHSTELVSWMRREFYDGKDKSFPGWMVGDQASFDGLKASDGCKGDRVEWIDSTSKSITQGVIATLAVMGLCPNSLICSRSKGTYANAKPLYRVSWLADPKRQRVWRDERYICHPVRKIDRIEGPSDVYDVGVQDGHHSFLANGFAAHNCVSHGFGHGVDLLQCVQIAIGKQAEAFKQTATEAVYGMARVDIGGQRNSRQDGAVGAWAAKAVSTIGTLSRDVVGAYDGARAKLWGAQGVPKELEAQAPQHKVKTASLVRTYAELEDALANGYPVPVCSNQGFTTQRDGDGFCAPKGHWGHCCLPGAMISALTPKRADEVKVGDLVLGHDGKVHPVVASMPRQHQGEIVFISPIGLPAVSFTPEHPVLVQRKLMMRTEIRPSAEFVAACERAGSPIARPIAQTKVTNARMWVQAHEVQVGDCLLMPARVNAQAASSCEWIGVAGCVNVPTLAIMPSDALAFLFGVYVANGSSEADHRVTITLPSAKPDLEARVTEAFSSIGLTARTTRAKRFVRVHVDSAVVARTFKRWFGGGQEEKRIPEFLFAGWNLKEVVAGIHAGDGDGGRLHRPRIYNTSRTLVAQLWMILVARGLSPTIYLCSRSKGTYANAKPLYAVNYAREEDWSAPKKSHRTGYRDGYYVMPVKSVKRQLYDGMVYNWEVEGSNSYVADGVAVHNCMLLVGVRTGARPGACIFQSWGMDNPTGPLALDQPPNSFWADKSVVDAMLGLGDSWSLSAFDGYPGQQLPAHWSLMDLA